MEEMLAGKPPTTGERERREAQRRSAGNGGDVGDKTANHSEKKGKAFSGVALLIRYYNHKT